MTLTYPEEIKLNDNKRIINKVLKKRISLKINNFSLQEDFVNDCSCVSFVLKCNGNKEQQTLDISNKGAGVSDAVYTGVLEKFKDRYISLQEVVLHDFIVTVDFKGSKTILNTDAPVEVKIALLGTSSARNKLYFKAKSNSLVKSGIMAVCKAMEYLINSELAAIQLYKDIQSANKRQRTDLQDVYVSQLSALVEFVSYAEVIERSK